LARHFGSEPQARLLQEELQAEDSNSSSSSRWAALALVYEQLARLDASLSSLGGVGDRKALPKRRPPAADRESRLLEAVCRQGPLDPEALGVVEAMVATVQRSDHPELQAALLRAIAREVVREAAGR
jgi:hypothetical protein